MSTVISISTCRRYGVARVCRVWSVARSGVYRRRRSAVMPLAPRRRPGPPGPMPDSALVEAIRRVLTDSPFHGEGYRKVWARLRHQGLRTSKERVRRLMRENGLSAATQAGRPRGPRNHDGTIIPETIDTLWGRSTVKSRYSSPSTTARRNASASTRLSTARATRRWSRSGKEWPNGSAGSRRMWQGASASVTIMGASTCPTTSKTRSPGSGLHPLRPSSGHQRATVARRGSSGPSRKTSSGSRSSAPSRISASL